MEKNNTNKQAFKRKLIIITIILFSLMLVSCTDVFSKKEAYCFSGVFDKIDNNYVFSIYAKTVADSKDEEIQLENLNFDFSANSPIQAIKLSEDANYEIYYKSCIALFFSDNLSDNDIYSILVSILNDTKYQSYVYIYKDTVQVDTLKTEAEKILINEKIDSASKNKFMRLTDYIKEKQF